MCEHYLFFEQQSHPLKELVPINGSQCNVEEEAVEDWFWDPLEGEREEQEREANQEVCHQTCQPGLLHTHNPGSRKTGIRGEG